MADTDLEVHLRIAVISDLHAYSGESKDPAPSFVRTSAPEDARSHPIAALKDLIQRDSLSADLVVCPGDLADKADPAAARYVWEKLQVLKENLGANELVATAGNHDLDSRYQYNDFDAKGVLQSLTPYFPIRKLALSDQYWSRNYCIVGGRDYRVIVLNSAAYHGCGPNENPHGRISKATIAWLREELGLLDRKPVNILLCHHHPHRHGDIEEDDYSAMKNGHSLLLELEGLDQDWLVIHGHKHHPRLAYAAGGSSSATVFGAGSFSASLYPEQQTRARNQFYILDIYGSSKSDGCGELRGKFRAWDWIWDRGWYPADASSGLPHTGGFGHRGSVAELASRVASVLHDSGEPFLDWTDLVKELPVLEWLLPSDQARLFSLLKSSHGVISQFDDKGRIQQMALSR